MGLAQVSVVVPCVGYSDFLRLTLPHTLRACASVAVVTAPADVDTIQCAEALGVPVHVTDVWYQGGAFFDKAAALNSCLDESSDGDGRWTLSLDADILVPPHVLCALDSLDLRCLYGARRRMCATLPEWNDFVSGRRRWETFAIYQTRIQHGLWGTNDATNMAAICGYFQLWHSGLREGRRRFQSCPTAAAYDIQFALSFEDGRRQELPNCEVLHLGPVNTNWKGRCSESWEGAARLEIRAVDRWPSQT